MKRTVLAGILLYFLFPPKLYADPLYIIIETIFLPHSYYVGDLVEARIKCRSPLADEVTAPSVYPDEYWLTIEGVSVRTQNGIIEIKILFRSFYLGTRSLPPINLGPFSLENVKIYTNPITAETHAVFSGLQGQVYIPSTGLLLGLLFGSLLIIPIFLMLFSKSIKKIISTLLKIGRERKPAKRFFKRVDDLKRQANKISSKEFYIIFTNEIRHYLTRRTGRDFQTITTSEIDNELNRLFFDIPNVTELVKLLQFGDEIKFSTRRATLKKELEDISLALFMVQTIEEQVKNRNEKVEGKLSELDV